MDICRYTTENFNPQVFESILNSEPWKGPQVLVIQVATKRPVLTEDADEYEKRPDRRRDHY